MGPLRVRRRQPRPAVAAEPGQAGLLDISALSGGGRPIAGSLTTPISDYGATMSIHGCSGSRDIPGRARPCCCAVSSTSWRPTVNLVFLLLQRGRCGHQPCFGYSARSDLPHCRPTAIAYLAPAEEIRFCRESTISRFKRLGSFVGDLYEHSKG